MKSPLKKKISISLFALSLSLMLFPAAAQVQNPVPAPAPPLPPATNPAAKPADTSAIRFNPPVAPNEPRPAPIAPSPQPFPKSTEDTVFRNIEQAPPGMLQRDTTGKPKK